MFLNITGGLKIDDPAIDLAVICSILSSNFDLNIDSKTCFSGEIGLSGEIRPVPRIHQRINEAEKWVTLRFFISKYTKNLQIQSNKIKIVKVAKFKKESSFYSNSCSTKSILIN